MVFTLLRRGYSIFVTSESCMQSLLHIDTYIRCQQRRLLLFREDILARHKKTPPHKPIVIIFSSFFSRFVLDCLKPLYIQHKVKGPQAFRDI